MPCSIWRAIRRRLSIVAATDSEKRSPLSVLVVSWPRSPSPRSIRARMLRSEAEMATTLSMVSSPLASSSSTLVIGAAGISPPPGMTGDSGDPEVISTYLSPKRPRVLIRACESSRTRSA